MKKYLVIGAHPDDPDLMFGGAALKACAAGHKVKFVSVCNGDCGHYSMEREALAERRFKEAQKVKTIAGLDEYQVLNHHDCGLKASLENRKEIVRIIRDFAPDVVISHRTNDYHADHRAAAQLVQDSAYLITVPLYCADVPIPEKSPVYCYSWDRFKQPPFKPDIVVEIDSVVEKKIDLINCHESQFFEWLPWDMGIKDFDKGKMSEQEARQWLKNNWLKRNLTQASMYTELIEKFYGDMAPYIKHIEAFEITEYGRIPDEDELKELFYL